jgi:hypothetical protein
MAGARRSMSHSTTAGVRHSTSCPDVAIRRDSLHRQCPAELTGALALVPVWATLAD